MAEPVNYAAFCGIGLENTAGTPVKSQVELDFISETLRGQGEPIRRRTINRTRAVKGAVMGPYSAEGDLNVEWTPDKLTKLLYAAFNVTSTGSATPYTHVFKTGDVLRPLSVQIKRDDSFFIYPGQYVQRITLRAVIDQILEGTFGLAGKGKEILYSADQSDSGITVSTEDPFVFHQATVTLHGVSNTDTNNWELSVETGLQRPKGLGAGRAPNRAHPGDSLVTGSFDIVFDTVEEHRRWMGASSSSYPIQVGDSLQTLDARLKFTASASRELQIDLPKIYYRASEPAITGREGVIIQRCQFSALWDTTSSTDIMLTLKNSESNTSITGLGMDIS